VRFRDMLAAAASPWVGVWAKDGSAGAYVLRTSITLFANSDGSSVRVRHEWNDVFHVSVGVRRDPAGERKPRRDYFVVSNFGEAHAESSPTLLGLWVGKDKWDRHLVSLRDAQGDHHLFSWKPAIDVYIGRLGVLCSSREGDRAGRIEWKAKAAAEKAANDSKAAA
jgi:hypothetical protein